MTETTTPRTPEQIAAAVLDAHRIRPDWVRSGEQIAPLLAEAAGAAREGYTAPEAATPDPDGTRARVASMAADFEEYAAGLFAKLDKAERKGNHEKADRIREQVDQSSYGQQVSRVVSITLAGGGPSHWLEVTLDDDGDVSEVWSVATWWSEPTRTQIHEGSALWRFAEHQTSHYGPQRDASGEW